jgi:hypothetical protein
VPECDHLDSPCAWSNAVEQEVPGATKQDTKRARAPAHRHAAPRVRSDSPQRSGDLVIE